MMSGSKIVALYSRVSTEEQVERGQSIPDQKLALEKEAIRRGWSFRHYSDEAISGGSTKRADFMRMMRDIENGEIGAVIFFQFSRGNRDMLDALLLQRSLEEKGIEVISLSENFDLKTDEGDMMFKMQAFINERYRKDHIKRARFKSWDLAKNGKFTGGQPPFGYDNKDKKLIINEDETAIVRQMFNRFEEVPSYRGITTWLNKADYKTKRGTTFAQSTIRRILTNPVYKGYPTFGKRPGGKKFTTKDKWLTAVKGNYEPIITEEQFDRVQDIAKKKIREYPQRKYKIVYLLSSLIRCECGGTLNGYTQIKKTSGKLYHYYKCHNWQSKGTCPGNTWPKDVIEKRVIEGVKEQIKIHFDKDEVSRLSLREESAKDSLANAKSKLKDLQRKQGKYIELYVDENMPKIELDKKMILLKTQIENAEANIRKQEAELNPKKKKDRLSIWERINRLNGDFASLSESTKRDVLKQVVKGIIAHRNGELELELYEV